MKYIEFKAYLKKVVLYQSRNKKFRHWSMARRCEVNFTTRQLSNLCGVCHTTISRWLKKMYAEGIIGYPRFKNTEDKKFQSMVFWRHLQVVSINLAIAKKRAYRFIKGKIKASKDKYATLKSFTKVNKEKTRNISIIPTMETNYFYIKSGGVEYNLENYDFRRNDPEPRVLTRESISKEASSLIDFLS